MNKRIFNEIAFLKNRGNSENITFLEYKNNIIRVQIKCADSSIYENENYILNFILPSNFPFSAPIVRFEKDVPLNEHVYSNGDICNNLKKRWTPAFTIFGVAISIISMLSEAKVKKRPPNDSIYSFLKKLER